MRLDNVLALPHRSYRVSRAVDRLCLALGWPERTVYQHGLRVRIRRQTVDWNFVHNVLVQREYLQHGLTIGPTDTVVDVGGNIGTFAVLAGSLARQGRVITAEPDTANLRLLKHNVALNRVPVTIVPVAIAGTSGTVSFYVASEGGGFHTTNPNDFNRREYDATYEVRAMSLADLFEAYDVTTCDFLKLDCEAAEFDIVAHAPLELLQRVRQVALEYHADHGDPRIDALRQRLEASGLRTLNHEPFPTRGGHLFLRR